MKQVAKGVMLKSFFTFLMIAFVQAALWAQDDGASSSGASSGSSTTTTTKSVSVTSGSDWYTSPWVWVAGAAVFILLLVALLRGGGSSSASRTDRVTVTKSSSTDV